MVDQPQCKAAGTYNGSTWSLRLVRCRADRIAAVLADLERVELLPVRTHVTDCWRWHAGCLAARIRRTLTEETTDGR